MDTLQIPINNRVILKNANNIVRIQASSNCSIIYCNDEKHPITVAKILQWFQDNLPTENFVRTHRTNLINKQYTTKKDGNYMLLHNGESISISRRKKNNCKRIA